MHVHGINASTVTRASAGTLVVVSFARGALCRTGGALCSSAAAPAVDAHLPSWRSEAVVASARAPGSNLCLCCDASLDLFLFIVDLGRAGCLTDDVGEAPLSRAASVSMGGLSGELERRRQSLTAKPWRVLRISQGRRVAKSSCGLLIIRRWPCASGAPAGRFFGVLVAGVRLFVWFCRSELVEIVQHRMQLCEDAAGDQRTSRSQAQPSVD